MAKNIWLLMVVVFALASTSAALKCYFCNDCENDSPFSGPCPDGADTCSISNIEGKVQKSCVPKSICGVGDMMNNLKGLMAGHEGNMEMDPEMENLMKAAGGDKPMIECCDTDYCNAASNTMINSALLFLLPLTLYILQC